MAKKKPTKKRYSEDKLKAVPKDWDRTKHLPLKVSDFTDRKFYFTWRAELCEAQAKAFRDQAANNELVMLKKKAASLAKKLQTTRQELQDKGLSEKEIKTLLPG